jgi:hypothetical protein
LSELEKYARLAKDIVQQSSGDYVTAVEKRLRARAERNNIPEDVWKTDIGFMRPLGSAGGDVVYGNGRVSGRRED